MTILKSFNAGTKQISVVILQLEIKKLSHGLVTKQYECNKIKPAFSCQT